MKKFLFVIVCVVCLCSCELSRKHNYVVTFNSGDTIHICAEHYDVCLNEGMKDYTEFFDYGGQRLQIANIPTDSIKYIIER